MKVPSTKAFREAFPSIPPAKITKLRKILRGDLDPLSVPSVERWALQCFNRPAQIELLLSAANDLLDGFGVEPLETQEEWETLTSGPRREYINMGETYAVTLIYDHDHGRFFLASYGDVVEQN
jgi:hypothetical protein